jgi:hypothetical protein
LLSIFSLIARAGLNRTTVTRGASDASFRIVQIQFSIEQCPNRRLMLANGRIEKITVPNGGHASTARRRNMMRNPPTKIKTDNPARAAAISKQRRQIESVASATRVGVDDCKLARRSNFSREPNIVLFVKEFAGTSKVVPNDRARAEPLWLRGVPVTKIRSSGIAVPRTSPNAGDGEAC